MWLEQAPRRPRLTRRSAPSQPANSVRRLAKGEATRRRILDAAMRVVAEEGYHAATHQRIAEASGLVRTAINYHYPEPDRLSEALVLHLYRLRAERVAAVVGAPEVNDGGSSIIEAYWRLLREIPFVAIAELECCARTDHALRARLAAARWSSVQDGEQAPEGCGPNLDRLSVYVLEGLARGLGHQDGTLLERRVLGLLKRVVAESGERS